MGAWEMHHRSTKTRPTKPCLRRMVDPHLLASGVCEKERKSELNSRAAGKGVWHLPKAPSKELLLPPNALGQHFGAPAGWAEVKLGLLARAYRTTPTPARTPCRRPTSKHLPHGRFLDLFLGYQPAVGRLASDVEMRADPEGQQVPYAVRLLPRGWRAAFVRLLYAAGSATTNGRGTNWRRYVAPGAD